MKSLTSFVHPFLRLLYSDSFRLSVSLTSVWSSLVLGSLIYYYLLLFFPHLHPSYLTTSLQSVLFLVFYETPNSSIPKSPLKPSSSQVSLYYGLTSYKVSIPSSLSLRTLNAKTLGYSCSYALSLPPLPIFPFLPNERTELPRRIRYMLSSLLCHIEIGVN